MQLYKDEAQDLIRSMVTTKLRKVYEEGK